MNFAITLILSLLSLVTFGQVNFTAQVSKDMVQTGERFVLKLEANTNFSKFEPPNFANFSVVSGPNQSSSMSWVNGQMTASKSYTYYLVANKEGKFKIGEAKIEADGKIYTSNPIEIEVIKGQQTTPQQKQQGTRQQNQSATNIDDNLFMRLLLSKNKGVVGEQIIATYKLYTRVELSGIVDNKEPKNSGF